MPDGHPPPWGGDWFVAVHQGGQGNDMMNALDERYDFRVTLSARLTVPPDRAGDTLLAQKLVEEKGFNRKAHRLKTYLHMSWGLLQEANQYLLDANPDADEVYGFCEPAHFSPGGADDPQLVGGEWFGGDPGTTDCCGLVQELRFEGARRLQAPGTFA